MTLASQCYAASKMSDDEIDKQIAYLFEPNEATEDYEKSFFALKKIVNNNELSKRSLIKIYYHLSRVTYELNLISETLQYTNKALDLIGPNNEHKFASTLLVYKGYSMNILLLDRADLVFLQAIDSAAKYGNSIDEIDAYFLMADYYIQKSQFITAHTYTAKAIVLAEEKNEAASIADGHALNGTIYYEMDDYEEALEQINIALGQYLALKNEYNIISMQLLRASIYLAQKEYTKAEDAYLNILADPSSSISVVFHCYTGLAKSHFEQGKYTEAMELIRNSESMIEDVENTSTKIIWYLQKLRILTELGETEQANKLLNGLESSAFFSFDKMDTEKSADFFKIKARLYEANKQYELALQTHKIYFEKNAANKKNRSDKVAEEIRAKYFSDRKDEKFNQMAHQLEINGLTLRNNEQESFYQQLLIIFSLCVFFLFTIVLVKQIKIRHKLSRLVHTDALTKVSNRYSLMKRGNKAFDDRQEEDKNMCVILLDIDDFKSINDSYGHSVGDSVIKKVALLGKDVTPEKDWFGRLGGEEFVSILQNSTEQEALLVAESIRSAIYNYDWKKLNLANAVSVSVGVASVGSIEGSGHKMSFASLLNLSDKAMYMAKKAGKNKVVPFSRLQP